MRGKSRALRNPQQQAVRENADEHLINLMLFDSQIVWPFYLA
jgi:hypothetical protein